MTSKLSSQTTFAETVPLTCVYILRNSDKAVHTLKQWIRVCCPEVLWELGTVGSSLNINHHM